MVNQANLSDVTVEALEQGSVSANHQFARRSDDRSWHYRPSLVTL